MQEQLLSMEGQALKRIHAARDFSELKEIRVNYLGKKGEITQILRGMGALDPEERPVVGSIANQVKENLREALREREEDFKEKARENEYIRDALDITLPGIPLGQGHPHPITLVMEEIKEIFMGMGYKIEDGPELETDYYNFEALNIPKDHPARDMQDSFFLTEDLLLRTHTSPVQARVMEKKVPELPIRVIVPGKVYRRDDDATHSFMFHQVEGLAVDEKISLSDLKGTLLSFARQMFGPQQKIRLRPSYFPFTEPSAEVDISCVMCRGQGCRVCGSTG